MTAPALDEREHIAALSAAIKPHIDINDVFQYGKVPGLDGNPGVEPRLYVLVQVERRALPAGRSARMASRSSWRASVRAVGTTIGECQWLTERIAIALEAQRLTVGGLTSTPIQHENGESPEFEKGRADALTRYTYAL